jgi:hypothetical protein
LIDHQVEEVRQTAMGQVGVRLDSLPELVEGLGRFKVNADQVLPRKIEVVFPDLDAVSLQLRGKEDHEGVPGVLLDLRPLVLVPNVLQRQRVELEGLLQQLEVGVVGALDVKPESLLALAQAFGELRLAGLELRALGRDQIAANAGAPTLTLPRMRGREFDPR